jgi:hypothetical protein
MKILKRAFDPEGRMNPENYSDVTQHGRYVSDISLIFLGSKWALAYLSEFLTHPAKRCRVFFKLMNLKKLTVWHVRCLFSIGNRF